MKRQDPNVFAFFTRLHMGVGAGAPWILLVDRPAGGLIALALSGALLRSRLHGPRLLALGLFGGSIVAALRRCGKRGFEPRAGLARTAQQL